MYEEYLRRLLEPLGVYAFTENSISGAEICALGAGLDAIGDQLETAEKEALTATAEEEGLRRRENLFARRSAAATAEDRRAAIAALLQIDGDSLTPSDINRTILGCGIRARAMEIDTGHLQVIFPDVGGVPAEFDQIRDIILDILPCHLEVEFYFRYMTWTECERGGYTWAMVEAAGHTWDTFQMAPPAED
ncbi:hypothetical protein [Oscillibacter sp.]|uniref:hypothetical protein n=1 Tax=Oscillibacter sp. TaxID=1945593 RepID=UPI0026181E3E|nr:hypothetical protein [Oscillibacter sp.]MDD3346817.1 hypothetical protein [Oscillibacter sp.]